MQDTRNHEITKHQTLLTTEGGIAEPGWSRQPLQSYDRSDVRAPKFRIKEWDYYLVLGADFGVAFTISDDGYIGLQSVSLLDFAAGWEHTETILNLFPMGKYRLPPDSEQGDTVYKDKRLQMSFRVTPGRRVIDCQFADFWNKQPFRCHIELTQPKTESMVIATPWAGRPHAFYYNRKINCMPADGWAEYGGKTYKFNPARDFGTLDWGRGVWTYDNVWYWGSGNCLVDGHPFGFNIGYGFGDTAAATENVLLYDGKIHKLADVTFHIPEDDYLKPWKFTSSDGRFTMDFQPLLDRAADLNVGVIASGQHQVFGKMTGTALLDDGTPLHIRDCLCFAEKVHNRY